MAEAIGVASGLLALATFAFESSVTLYKTIQSFQNHPKNVRELLEELEALTGVLGSLTDTVSAVTDVDLSALDLPLKRCGNTCQEFEQKLLKCSAGSGGIRANFRGWAQLKYLGDDINSFKQMLAGYKSTIIIAITDANLRNSTVTAESIKSYRDLIRTATVDLEDRLEIIDGKLESIFERTVTESDSDATELRQIKEDRLSTQKCLQICAQLSDHIDQIPVPPIQPSRSFPSLIDPGKVTTESLQECRQRLNHTAATLERHMEDLIDRLVRKSKTTMTSEEEVTELSRLREDWESARQCIDICSKADTNLNENISIIDNYAIGDDAIQYLVSTNGKTIHGRNRGFSSITRQVGGHLSDASLQQLSRDMSRVGVRKAGDDGASSRGNTPSVPDDVENESSAEFQERHGRGFKLASKSTPDIVMSSKGSAGGEASSFTRR